jgi:hypothetical protein
LVRPLVGPSVCSHDEIFRNPFFSKTGYVAIASRLGLGNHLVFLPFGGMQMNPKCHASDDDCLVTPLVKKNGADLLTATMKTV